MSCRKCHDLYFEGSYGFSEVEMKRDYRIINGWILDIRVLRGH